MRRPSLSSLCFVWWLSAGALADQAVPPATPPPPVTARAGWCVIVGDHGYADVARAQARALELRGAGFAEAAVYDTRDYTDLAWGRLALVVATHDATKEGKASALAAVQRLRREHKASAYTKPCHPRAAIRPVEKAADIRAVPALGDEPLQIRWKGLGAGCFAWSVKEKAAACVVGTGTSFTRSTWSVDFGDAPCAKVPLAEDWKGQGDGYFPRESDISVATRRKVEACLAAGRYVALPPAMELPGDTLHVGSPRFTVTIKKEVEPRKRARYEGPEPPREDHHDVELRCGRGEGDAVLSHTVDLRAWSFKIRVYLIPGGRHVVVESVGSYAEVDMGDEAQDLGGSGDGAVVDLADFCAKK